MSSTSRPAARAIPQKHIFEEVFYVIDGHGSTQVETYEGKKHTFEWGPKSLFALPLNCRYQHFNGSGTQRARLYSCNNLPLVINLYRNDAFRVPERREIPRARRQVGLLLRRRRTDPEDPGPPHVGNQLRARPRGLRTAEVGQARRRRLQHHVRRWPTARCTPTSRRCRSAPTRRATATAPTSTSCAPRAKATRCCGTTSRRTWCASTGITASSSRRPTACSTSTSTPARSRPAISPSPWAACAIPTLAEKRAVWLGMDVSVRDGGKQIEYEDQNPKVHPMYLEALAKHGAKSKMGKFVDESKYPQRSEAEGGHPGLKRAHAPTMARRAAGWFARRCPYNRYPLT